RGRMNQTRRAIVIGGGIAGPAVSLFLQRGGIEPLLFEAYPPPAKIRGGLHEVDTCRGPPAASDDWRRVPDCAERDACLTRAQSCRPGRSGRCAVERVPVPEPTWRPPRAASS